MSRRHSRVRVRLTASVRIEPGDRMVVCPTRDVSETGCFLETIEDIPRGTALAIAVMDLERGEVIEVRGEVTRRVVPDDPTTSGGGIGILLHEPPIEWAALVDRQIMASGPISAKPAVRLRVLVVGDDDRRRGALALYVKSGWDIRFASNLEGAVEALAAVALDAVITEHDLDDQRWTEILAETRRIRPNARRIIRCNLHGGPTPETSEHDLVHRVVDLDSGMDALLDALTADLGLEA